MVCFYMVVFINYVSVTESQLYIQYFIIVLCVDLKFTITFFETYRGL